MNEVQWIGGGPVTKEQIDFFLGPATHDMIQEELSQLKHKVSQDTQTIPISEDRDNLIYSQTREEDDGPEIVPSSFNPSSVDGVVSDEIVDTVVSRDPIACRELFPLAPVASRIIGDYCFFFDYLTIVERK